MSVAKKSCKKPDPQPLFFTKRLPENVKTLPELNITTLPAKRDPNVIENEPRKRSQVKEFKLTDIDLYLKQLDSVFTKKQIDDSCGVVDESKIQKNDQIMIEVFTNEETKEDINELTLRFLNEMNNATKLTFNQMTVVQRMGINFKQDA